MPFSIIQQGFKEGLYTGAAACVGKKGKKTDFFCIGSTTEHNEIPVDCDTLFDLASLTKPLSTAPAILMLVNDGLLKTDQHISDIFDNFHLPHLREITISHLLTHTSGLPSWKNLYSSNTGQDSVITDLLLTSPEHKPGTHYCYSCLGYLLLGLIVKEVSGLSLDDFTKQRIFLPLNMHNTCFNPAPNLIERIFTTGFCSYRNKYLKGKVHDINAFAMNGVAGNAGLFSSISDIAKYCDEIVNINSSSVFQGKIFKLMTSNVLTSKFPSQTFGWFGHNNDMLPLVNNKCESIIGHTGFTGTSIVLNLESRSYSVLLTNRVCKELESSQFSIVRRYYHCAIMSSNVY